MMSRTEIHMKQAYRSSKNLQQPLIGKGTIFDLVGEVLHEFLS
jgi:hypothetical protein